MNVELLQRVFSQQEGVATQLLHFLFHQLYRGSPRASRNPKTTKLLALGIVAPRDPRAAEATRSHDYESKAPRPTEGQPNSRCRWTMPHNAAVQRRRAAVRDVALYA